MAAAPVSATGEEVGEPWAGPVPVPDPETAPFWEGLAEGELRLPRCSACGFLVYYPVACCPRCRGRDLVYEGVPGEGRIYSFTVVHREFTPGIAPPYVVALVELDVQEGLRLLTNLVSCPAPEVRIGLPVRPRFRRVAQDAGLVFFEPRATP